MTTLVKKNFGKELVPRLKELAVKFGYARPVFANLFSRFRKAFDCINLNILVIPSWSF